MKVFDHHSGGYLRIGNANIYYEVHGNKTDSALLFLHGGFGNMEDFNDIIAELPEEFMLIGIDSRGQGKSTLGSAVLSYELLQNDVEKILAHLNINNLMIIGFSDGGNVAYRLAALSNLKIHKLITIGSRWHTKNIEPMKEKMLQITSETWKVRYPFHYESYQKLNPEPDFNHLTQLLVNMWLDSSASSCANEHVKNISCPTLVTRGEGDPFISSADIAELSDLVKTITCLNIPGARHVAHKEQAEFFLLKLKEFLSIQ